MPALSLSAARRIRRALLAASAMGLLLALLPAAFGADADTLARDASNGLRKARGMMFAGKSAECRDELAKVAKTIAELKAADPNNRSIERLERDAQRLEADLARRAGPATSTPATTPGPAAAAAKLPSGVSFRLKKIDDWLKMDNLGRAEGLMAEIEKQYAGQFPPDHPDVVAAKARIAEAKAKQDADAAAKDAAAKAEQEAKALREATSQAWVQQLTTYTKDYDLALERANPKRLMAGPTSDAAELERQKALYDAATKLFDDYKKAELPAGKTPELEQAEKDMAAALKDFDAAYKQSMEQLSRGPGDQIQAAFARLKADEAWRTDPRQTPGFVPSGTMKAIREAVAKAEKSLPAGDATLAALKGQLADLEAQNAERHRIRCERTFMLPDRFQTAESPALKAKANEILTKAVPGATLLRTHLISKAWFQEEVIDFADTAKTQARRRVTRGVTAQVAAKSPAGVLLYSVFVGQDQQPDGDWGPLYGNVHQTAEPMLEKNVGAAAP